MGCQELVIINISLRHIPYHAPLFLIGIDSLSQREEMNVFIHPANNGYVENVQRCLGDGHRFPLWFHGCWHGKCIVSAGLIRSVSNSGLCGISFLFL